MLGAVLRCLDASAPGAIDEAAECLVDGGLVAFPTETVYGLGARADDDAAVGRIFEAKGRPPHNPLIVHVADAAHAFALARDVPDDAVRLATSFWPGPLTLVMRGGHAPLSRLVTGGGPTVGLRVPDHPTARALLERAHVPVAAPSANRSTTISPTEAAHVRRSLGDRVDVLLDGGPTGYGIESTIVDVTRRPVALLRHGAIPRRSIERCLGAEVMDETARVTGASERSAAPGGEARHYAPDARLVVVEPPRIRQAACDAIASGERVGVITRRGAPRVDDVVSTAWVEVLPDDAAAFAARLYASLHRLDDAGCTSVLVAAPPTPAATAPEGGDHTGGDEAPNTDEWAAVRDRLRRAAVR
jgi:L-threonylcarbamoyladenylate synthase